ncbi:MAG TPA: hypothetical protein VN408_14085 [Actinoplanes sp.]|nr:hypothetical protein [Actinoplanes sp.]
MVQPTETRPDDKWGSYRVGTKNDEPETTPAAAPAPARAPLPPIQWSRVDRGKLMREDLFGIAEAVVVVLLGFTVLIGITMGIAIALASAIQAAGFDPSASY